MSIMQKYYKDLVTQMDRWTCQGRIFWRSDILDRPNWVVHSHKRSVKTGRKDALQVETGGKDLSSLEEEQEGLYLFTRQQGARKMTEIVETKEKFECRSCMSGSLW